jgi:hypothetical protein
MDPNAPVPANMFDMNDLPPHPPRLIRQNAVEIGNRVNVNGTDYDIRNVDGIEFIIINNDLYNLKTDANGRYIIMTDGVTQRATGGRRRSRRNKRSRSRRRSRRV